MRREATRLRLVSVLLLLLGGAPFAAVAEEGETCDSPEFRVRGWEDAQTLILEASTDKAQTFDVQVAVTKVKGGRLVAFKEAQHQRNTRERTTRYEADGTETQKALEAQKNIQAKEESLSTVNTDVPLIDIPPCNNPPADDPNANSFEYIGCYSNVSIRPKVASKGSDIAGPQTELVVRFSREVFNRLLVKDGEIHVHYSKTDDSSCSGWQHLTAYDRSEAKIEAGMAYVRNGAGNWDSRGEASIRAVTRWRLGVSGGVEIRYNGLTKNDQSNNSSSTPNTKDNTFNPFNASDGILRANFGLAYHLRYQGVIPSLAGSLVGGFGLSTLKGVTGSDGEFSNTQGRYFAGVRLNVPRYHVEGLDQITNPKGSLQFTIARDKIWGDHPNRFVVEGYFEFTEIGGDKKGNGIPVSARLFWDAPSNLSGPSDVRVSILVAAPIFKH